MPEREWERLPDQKRHRLDVPRISVLSVAGLTQYMVSGNLKTATMRAGVDIESVGALGLASGERYSVRLARDRLLIVSREDDLLEDGWHKEGYAVSWMSAAMEIVELSGPLSLELVKRATTLAHVGSSPCAVTTFAGVTACIYRFGDTQKFRVHFDCGLASYIWNWLARSVDIIALADERTPGMSITAQTRPFAFAE